MFLRIRLKDTAVSHSYPSSGNVRMLSVDITEIIAKQIDDFRKKNIKKNL